MRKILLKITVIFCAVVSYGQQYEYAILAPEISYSQGTGIWEMSDIETARGVGLNLSIMKSEHFSFNSFYTFNGYSFYEEKNYANVPSYGKAEVDISNASRVSTFGGVFRWSPKKISTPVIKPVFGLGGGAAIHTSVWKIAPENYVIPHPQAGETYEQTHYSNDDKGSTWTTTEVYPETKTITHHDRGLISRDATMMGVGELGISFDLSKNREWKNMGRSFRDGLIIYVHTRLELGGQVSYKNAAANPHHFYYNSGISENQNTPNSHLTPIEEIRFGPELKRHQMLYFQIGIRKALF